MSGASAPGRSASGVRRVLRAILLVVSIVTVLVALAVGGAVTARRYAEARHVSAAAPQITYTPESQLITLVQPGAESRRNAVPAPVTSCPCSATRKTVTVLPTTPSGVGQEVVVSIAQQWLWAYQDGKLVLSTPVTTGMPQLPTPTGTFHIMMKESNVWFYSPWPYGSPYYYTPEYVQYAMLFLQGGFYLHSAGWRDTFGPGTNVPHTNPDGTQETGSHGCVNMPVSAAGALYNWIGIGATVIIS